MRSGARTHSHPFVNFTSHGASTRNPEAPARTYSPKLVILGMKPLRAADSRCSLIVSGLRSPAMMPQVCRWRSSPATSRAISITIYNSVREGEAEGCSSFSHMAFKRKESRPTATLQANYSKFQWTSIERGNPETSFSQLGSHSKILNKYICTKYSCAPNLC